MLVLIMGIAFLGYVLPYGQMSLWGATVITSMLSAIPWLGGDFVQFKFLQLTIASLFIFIVALRTIGQVNVKALRGTKARSFQEKETYLGISYSFLSMFIGIVDGDGYIAATRTSKGYISCNLVLSLTITDAPMLYKIQSVLNIGRVIIYPNVGTAVLIIGRVDLQEVLFPLMFYHNIFFLTNERRLQFERAMHIMEQTLLGLKTFLLFFLDFFSACHSSRLRISSVFPKLVCRIHHC